MSNNQYVCDVIHIILHVEGSKTGGTQPVEVEACGSNQYRVLYTPGLVEGIAAGDVIRVTDEIKGYFEVLERGGNLAIIWASPTEQGEALTRADQILSAVGARLDGSIAKAAVWTAPVSAGFAVIETMMQQVVELIPESTWWYGNVYDEDNQPLNWW